MGDASTPNKTPRPLEGWSPTPDGIWNARREALHAVLAAQDALVGGLYCRAVNGLGERPLTPDALVVTAHAIRELVNRLPKVLDLIPAKKGGEPKESAARATLARELAAAGYSLSGDPRDLDPDSHETPGTGTSPAVAHREDSAGPVTERTTSDRAVLAGLESSVVIPRRLLDAIREVAAAHREGSSRAVDLRAAVVLGKERSGGADATITMFKKAIDEFENCRHPGGGDLPAHFFRPQDHYVALFEVIESVIESRVGRFFDVVDDLRLLLAQANQQLNGTWVTPDDVLLDQVLPRIGDPQHRRVFFNDLKNPRWVEGLDTRGVFNDPPLNVVTDAGLMPYMPWPQGDYLHAMVAEQPMAVAMILDRVVTRDTVWNVRELLVRCAGQMPADSAVILTPKICDILDDRRIGPHTGADVLAVLEVLVPGNHPKAAKRLLHKMLEPRPAPDSKFTFNRVTAGIDIDWYAEALERAVIAYNGNRDFLIWLTWWLTRHQEYSGSYGPDERDFTTLRRPAIGDHPHNHRHDEVGEALIDTVRDLSISRIRDHGPEDVADILHRAPAPVLRRIELYALAQTVQDHPDVVAVASDRLVDPQLNDGYTYLHELKQLAAAVLPLVDENTYRAWERPILAGPILTDATRERITSNYGGGDAAVAVAEFSERWQLSRLNIIDPDSLREPARTLREQLLEKEERRYRPDDHTAVGSEPNFAAMTPSEVLAILSNDHDFTVDASQPRDTLARALEVEVARRPREYTEVAGGALELDSGYVHRYISGLRDHLKAISETTKVDPKGEQPSGDNTQLGPAAKADIDWDALLHALLANRTWRDDVHQDHDFGTWRWVRQEVCNLLEDATPHQLPAHLRAAAAAITTDIVSDTDPTPETEERYGNGWDPFTYALNTVRPTAVRTLLAIARADTADHHPPAPDYSKTPLPVAALQTVTALLTPERDHSLTIAAAIGERAGWLLSSSRDWLDQHQPQLLSPDPFGDTFVTTAVALHNPHPTLIDYLRPAIDTMLQRAAAGEHLTNGVRDDSPLKLIGNHLVILNVWGRLDLNDPLLAQFFNDAPVEERAKVLGGLGWQFFHAGALDNDIRDRAAILWDHRLSAVRSRDADPAELTEFDWWIRCGHFDRTWWLPRLQELARDYQFEGSLHVGDDLEATSVDDPDAAVDVLAGLLRHTPGTALHYGLHRAAPVIIARALEHGSEAARKTADDVMDRIARNGGINIADEVEGAREQERLANRCDTNTDP
ncbi:MULTISPECIES: hypothetical protein [unclassified Nocardioides]|uniref:hypothetical protein n=1 Tax=unclassified Nocardioides TaxID=2615069 RepID=UPI00105508C3|nr:MULTISPECIES: hypothetical protein [unclassified Nocardioides]